MFHRDGFGALAALGQLLAAFGDGPVAFLPAFLELPHAGVQVPQPLLALGQFDLDLGRLAAARPAAAASSASICSAELGQLRSPSRPGRLRARWRFAWASAKRLQAVVVLGCGGVQFGLRARRAAASNWLRRSSAAVIVSAVLGQRVGGLLVLGRARSRPVAAAGRSARPARRRRPAACCDRALPTRPAASARPAAGCGARSGRSTACRGPTTSVPSAASSSPARVTKLSPRPADRGQLRRRGRASRRTTCGPSSRLASGGEARLGLDEPVGPAQHAGPAFEIDRRRRRVGVVRDRRATRSPRGRRSRLRVGLQIVRAVRRRGATTTCWAAGPGRPRPAARPRRSRCNRSATSPQTSRNGPSAGSRAASSTSFTPALSPSWRRSSSSSTDDPFGRGRCAAAAVRPVRPAAPRVAAGTGRAARLAAASSCSLLGDLRRRVRRGGGAARPVRRAATSSWRSSSAMRLAHALARGRGGGDLAFQRADLVAQRGGRPHLLHVGRPALLVLAAELIERGHHLGQAAFAFDQPLGDLPMLLLGRLRRPRSSPATAAAGRRPGRSWPPIAAGAGRFPAPDRGRGSARVRWSIRRRRSARDWRRSGLPTGGSPR